MNWFQVLMEWLQMQSNNLIIGLTRGMAQSLWYVEKVIAFLSDQITTSAIWRDAMDQMVTSLSNELPPVLRNILFGAGGGLFYMALILAGMFLIVPQLMQYGRRLVELDRILLMSLLVIALFISSTAGYNFIIGIETARQDLSATVTGAFAGSGSLSQLIAAPMQASSAEVVAIGDFNLPAIYTDTYFPAPTEFNTVEIVFYDNWVMGRSAFELQIESPASQLARRQSATQGVLIAAITLAPAWIVILITIAFAALTAVALVLIIFFLVSLPMGLFEYGATILGQIGRKYIFVWMLSLLMSVFPSVLLGVSEVTLSDTPTLTNLITYISVLVIVQLAVLYTVQMVFRTLTTTFETVSASLRTAVAPHATGVPLPMTQRSLPNETLGMLATAVAAPLLPALATAGVAVAGSAAGAFGKLPAKQRKQVRQHVFQRFSGQDSAEPDPPRRYRPSIDPYHYTHRVIHQPQSLPTEMQELTDGRRLREGELAPIFRAVRYGYEREMPREEHVQHVYQVMQTNNFVRSGRFSPDEAERFAEHAIRLTDERTEADNNEQ